jgi:hypothetical protein
MSSGCWVSVSRNSIIANLSNFWKAVRHDFTWIRVSFLTWNGRLMKWFSTVNVHFLYFAFLTPLVWLCYRYRSRNRHAALLVWALELPIAFVSFHSQYLTGIFLNSSFLYIFVPFPMADISRCCAVHWVGCNLLLICRTVIIIVYSTRGCMKDRGCLGAIH